MHYLLDVLTSPVTNPTQEAEMPFTSSPVVAIAASQAGALAGFEAVCSCGLVMRNTVAVNVSLDVQAHAAWHAAKATGRKAR